MEVLHGWLDIPDVFNWYLIIVVVVIQIEVNLSEFISFDASFLIFYNSHEFIIVDASGVISVPVLNIKFDFTQAGNFDLKLLHAELRVSDLAITVAIKITIVG